MKATTDFQHAANVIDANGRDDGAGRACAFRDGPSPIVQLQARVRYREDNGRGSLVSSGIPRPRAIQILDSILRLPSMRSSGIKARDLRVDLHREDYGRWQHQYGLALGIALVSSLVHAPVPTDVLLLGDVDLRGHICSVSPAITDALNNAIDEFRIESPVTVVLAPESAIWVRSASTVRVAGCRTLLDAIEATWVGRTLAAC